MRKLTLEQVLKRFKGVHSDSYNYSLVEYVNNSTKVIIVCKVHGNFYQMPYSHLSGNGCPKCRSENLAKYGEQKIQTHKEKFYIKANKVHNYRYDYKLTEYTGNRSKVRVICNVHGEFSQTPADHLRGAGCPTCGNAKNREAPIFDKLLTAVVARWGDTYDLSRVRDTYKEKATAVSIICLKHGEFKQSLKILSKGGGCRKCELERREIEGKICTKCKEIKPMSDFSINKRSIDNKCHKCKACVIAEETNPAVFALYGNKLVVGDGPEDRGGSLFVTCKQCGKTFQPTVRQCTNRIHAIGGMYSGESNFYCSEGCKENCDTFKAKFTPKSQRAKAKRNRACQGPIRKALLKSQLDEFGYTFCESCGNTVNVDLHHTQKIVDGGNEVNNSAGMLLLCQSCHIRLHKQC